jgi:molybdopterin-guanine dinucleotide biosynthesis protein A
MEITAIILAGGQATRMHGVDKGLMCLCQKPLIQHVIDRLAPQVNEIIINANRQITLYKALGYVIQKDNTEDFLGPLAGMSLGLRYAKHEYVLTVPCDLDLAERLMTALIKNSAEIAVASSDNRTHPVFCLCKKNVLPSLTAYLENGNRRVNTWQKSLNYIEVDFSDCSESFVNLNTPEDLAKLELTMSHKHTI